MRNLISFVALVVVSCSSLAAVGCATAGDETAYGVDDAETAGAGKFALWQSTDGQFHFHLKAGNGAILLASEGYATRTSAINGILSVQTNGVDHLRYLVVPATRGFVVRLLAGNGQVIGSSQVYATQGSATRGVTSTIDAIVDYLDQREASTTGARVDVVAGATGELRFHVYDAAGERVLSSDGYTTEAAAYNGALAVQASGQRADSYDVTESAGACSFTIRAANGEVVGTSRTYATRADAEAGVAALIALLPTIAVL